METTVNFNLLQTIGFIYDESKNSNLAEALFEKINSRLMDLALYFQVSEKQAFLLANIFVLNHEHDPVNIGVLQRRKNLQGAAH